MALRLGLPLRDMEMVQFHPTGLLAGPDTRMTGTVLEEGLRGAGGHLLNGSGERFMEQRDPRAERATRDFVSRCMYEEMRAGRTTPARRPPHQDEPPRARQGAPRVQGHGGALRRLRLRSGRRAGRGGADGALLHGRADLRGRYLHRAARPVRGGRGCRRRARRQPARRQRGGQLHGLRRHRRRDDGRLDRGQWRASGPGRGRARRRAGPGAAAVCRQGRRSQPLAREPARRHVGGCGRDPRRGRPAPRAWQARRHRGRAAWRAGSPTATGPST